MADVVIQVEGLSKKYQLGSIGTGTLSRDITKWWAKLRGKEDPYSKVDAQGFSSSDKNNFWALQDLNFEVKQGDAVGIIGKNGAGKSTLLKILSRVTSPTLGEIRVNGRIASLLEVGTGFHPELTGRENIFLNGAILGMTKREIRSKLDEIIAFSGVEKHIDTPVKRYSSGMYVRLAFAVAAHLEPEILIVDEVLAVGDAEFQKKCLGKMNDVAGEGRTVLFVSHNMAAVKNLCTKGIFLQSGKINLIGSAEQALSRYIESTTKNSNAEVVWPSIKDAPGNEEVKILAVRILNNNQIISTTIPSNEEFYIEMEYLNIKEGNFLTSNILLLDRAGLGVLSTGNWASATANVDAYSGASFKKGVYRSKVKINGNFLNAGVFHISVVILKDASIELAFAQEVISFEIMDTGEMSKEYSDEWLGVVRPKLEWETVSVTKD